MTRTHPSALAALLVAAVAVSPAAAQTTLRYKFKEGETLNYALEQKTKMTINIMGQQQNMNMDQTAQLAWKIESVDSDGAAKVQITFGRTKMSMDTPMGKVSVDSGDSKEPDDQFGKIMHTVVKAMDGLSVTGKMNTRGELSDVQVPAEAARKLQDLPGAKQFGDMLSPDGLKRMMGQNSLVLPKDAVSKGASWKHKMDMKLPFGKMGVEITYAYEGPGMGGEKVSVKPKMSSQADPGAPVAMTLKNQEGSGHAVFDNDAGKLKEVMLNQTFEMELDNMGQTLSIRMVQNATTRLVDKK